MACQTDTNPTAAPDPASEETLWQDGDWSVFHDHDDVICCSHPAQAAAARILREWASAIHHLREAQRDVRRLIRGVRGGYLAGTAGELDASIVRMLKGGLDQIEVGETELYQPDTVTIPVHAIRTLLGDCEEPEWEDDEDEDDAVVPQQAYASPEDHEP
jgi:hypothetical protein